MAKLELGAIENDKPVKLTHELPANVHRDFVAYEILARASGQPAPDREPDRTRAGAIHGDGPCFC